MVSREEAAKKNEEASGTMTGASFWTAKDTPTNIAVQNTNRDVN